MSARGDAPRLIVGCATVDVLDVQRAVASTGFGDVLVVGDRPGFGFFPRGDGTSIVCRPYDAVGRVVALGELVGVLQEMTPPTV